MSILGSCKALNLDYPGCCLAHLLQPCSNKGCHCDQDCHSNNDCCSDIADIGCLPTPSVTHGKTKSDDLLITTFYNIFIIIIIIFNHSIH